MDAWFHPDIYCNLFAFVVVALSRKPCYDGSVLALYAVQFAIICLYHAFSSYRGFFLFIAVAVNAIWSCCVCFLVRHFSRIPALLASFEMDHAQELRLLED